MKWRVDLLAHLDAFVAVAERRSFSTAAEQLHIAQPLLSRRIKNLERRLGEELFDRSQRHVEITELGQLLLPHAEDIIARTRHLLTLAESAQRPTSMTVGIPPECEPQSLARLIKDAAQHDVLITVHESPARDRAGAFENGTAGLRAAPRPRRRSGVRRDARPGIGDRRTVGERCGPSRQPSPAPSSRSASRAAADVARGRHRRAHRSTRASVGGGRASPGSVWRRCHRRRRPWPRCSPTPESSSATSASRSVTGSRGCPSPTRSYTAVTSWRPTSPWPRSVDGLTPDLAGAAARGGGRRRAGRARVDAAPTGDDRFGLAAGV